MLSCILNSSPWAGAGELDMVGQEYFSVNTGFYGIDFGHHTQHGCFPFPSGFFILSKAVRMPFKLPSRLA
jgi:hypothetical protein